MKYKNKNGFTLIELMITVGIVGILAAIAIPAYQNYVARSQVSEALGLTSGAKPLVAEYHSNKGVLPNTSSDVDYSGATGKYVSQTIIDFDGVVTGTLGNQASSNISGKYVYLVPTVESNGNLSWECFSSVAQKYLPSSCSLSTAPFSGTKGIGRAKIVNGIIQITGSTTTVLGVGYNGVTRFQFTQTNNGATYLGRSYPDGSYDMVNTTGDYILRFADNSGYTQYNKFLINTTAPDGTTQQVYLQAVPAPDGTMLGVYNPMFPTGFDTQSYTNLNGNEINALGNYYQNPNAQTYANYQAAKQTKIDYLNSLKDSNGNFPSNFPPSLTDYVNNGGTVQKRW